MEPGAKLGSVGAHALLGCYYSIDGGEKDLVKSIHHYKLAAIGGHEKARYNLAAMEVNKDRSMKHLVIAATCGYEKSLKEVGKGYKAGLVTKDEYASTLRAYQVSADEMKSVQRTNAIRQNEELNK